MKKTSLIIMTLLLFVAFGYSQITEITPPNSENVYIWSVAFIDESNGFAVGQNLESQDGYIYKTTDAGETWTEKTFASSNFRSVEFFNESTVVVSGWDGESGTKSIFQHSEDLGETWTAIDGPLTGVKQVQLYNGDKGFALGYGYGFGMDAGILYTKNAGKIWRAKASHSNYILDDMYFTHHNVGFLVGWDGNNGWPGSAVILKTTDGGVTFEKVNYESGKWVTSIQFVNEEEGFAVDRISGGRNILKTTDGGDSWDVISTVGEDQSLLNFIDNMNGYVAGKSGLFSITADGGETWTDTVLPTTQTVRSIDAFGKHLFMCGEGFIYKMEHEGAPVSYTQNLKEVETSVQTVNGQDYGVFPNPVNNQGVLQMSINKELKSFTLFDQTGKEVLKVSGQEGSSVNLSDYKLEKGIYLYRIYTKDEIFNGKLVMN